ncbi:uncharacterized protein LY89DRAFT_70453 [Mollisia scopiformis]|uniref:Uncharacterized protein n=1 Tax=Mollisia scopiformis TaxID=149040 RepID=A0A194XA56_MOLSC|nr:uncharacterized protein LY89DRAFT_70453 [Mollisia scopiformis]KUJ17051.1 hypothetical protein LY89DRAFT_70453 [Mollisia scopiformis]
MYRERELVLRIPATLSATLSSAVNLVFVAKRSFFHEGAMKKDFVTICNRERVQEFRSSRQCTFDNLVRKRDRGALGCVAMHRVST